jgi:hypothetical protein
MSYSSSGGARELAWTRPSAGGFPSVAGDAPLPRGASPQGSAALRGDALAVVIRVGEGSRRSASSARDTRQEAKRRRRPPPASIRIDGQDVGESARAVVVDDAGLGISEIDAVQRIIMPKAAFYHARSRAAA